MVVEGVVENGSVTLNVGREFADGTRRRAALTSADADHEAELQILRDAYADPTPGIEAREFMKQWAEASGFSPPERG